MGRAIISPQNALILTDDTAPEPDLMVLRYREDFYRQANPTANDVLIAIEVSDTTLEYDLEEKVPRYAAAGILEVWVFDSRGPVVHHFTQPADGAYRNSRGIVRGETLASVAISELRLDTADIFAPA